MNAPSPSLISLDAAPAESASSEATKKSKRGLIIGSFAVVACAVACSVPLLLGAGAISLGAGVLGGAEAFFAVALVSLGVVAGVVWFRRRRAGKAASLRATTAGTAGSHTDADACQTDHGCAGSMCGCS